MTVFVVSGEEPYRDGVNYVLRLLERRGLIESNEIEVYRASSSDLTSGKLPLDNFYVVGEHLATYGILKAMSGARGEVSLVSIDAHTDLLHDYLDHGSWLAYAIEGGLVKRAAIMAPVLMIPTTRRTKLWTKGIRIYPALTRTRKVRGRWKAYVSIRNVKRVLKDARDYLGSEVYLTVDMDVLRPEYRIARFQHGELTLDALLELIGNVLSEFNVFSCDMAEMTSRVRKSRKGREAVVDVFETLKEVRDYGSAQTKR